MHLANPAGWHNKLYSPINAKDTPLPFWRCLYSFVIGWSVNPIKPFDLNHGMFILLSIALDFI